MNRKKNRQEKELIVSTDKQIRDYYVNHSAPYGLRIKKLYQDGKDKIFEARVSDKIRILWVETIGLAVFTIAGNHDEIKNYCGASNASLHLASRLSFPRKRESRRNYLDCPVKPGNDIHKGISDALHYIKRLK